MLAFYDYRNQINQQAFYICSNHGCTVMFVDTVVTCCIVNEDHKVSKTNEQVLASTILICDT